MHNHKKKQQLHNNQRFIYIVLILFIILTMFSSLGSIELLKVRADSSIYTDVLTDLQTDENFDIADYPYSPLDYSLNVIQIAESSNDELFIYVYHPAKQLLATSINISTTLTKNYKNYALTYVNKSNTLYKYKVKNFKLSKSTTPRIYDISVIYRKYNAALDYALSTKGNTVDEVSYEVGMVWSATTSSEGTQYGCITSETITITDKYVGFIRYTAGIDTDFHVNAGIGKAYTDSHYVAFSTDKDIDRLIDVDISYTHRTYEKETRLFFGSKYTYGTKTKTYTTLTYDDVANVNGQGIHKYEWNRIQTTDEFLKTEDVKSNVESQLKDKQWVLRFYETKFSENISVGLANPNYEYGTKVEEVVILRLKFEVNGIVYNLGVVDNKQSGGLTPDNAQPETLWQKIVRILKIACKVILCVLALPLAIAIFSAIYYIVKYTIKGIAWLIQKVKNIFKGGGA